ncbi:MAG TPA: hypothetical protein VGC06_07535 [Actinomycetes bacterium]
MAIRDTGGRAGGSARPGWIAFRGRAGTGGISDSSVPLYLLPFAIGNFFGPLLLGPLFDTWGRKPAGRRALDA